MKKVTLYGIENETITVGELISKLSELPFDRPVFVNGVIQQPIIGVETQGEDKFKEVYLKTGSVSHPYVNVGSVSTGSTTASFTVPKDTTLTELRVTRASDGTQYYVYKGVDADGVNVMYSVPR